MQHGAYVRVLEYYATWCHLIDFAATTHGTIQTCCLSKSKITKVKQVYESTGAKYHLYPLAEIWGTMAPSLARQPFHLRKWNGWRARLHGPYAPPSPGSYTYVYHCGVRGEGEIVIASQGCLHNMQQLGHTHTHTHTLPVFSPHHFLLYSGCKKYN